MIDTHCHLDSQLYDNRDGVIQKMNGHIMIASSTNEKDLKEVISLCDKHDNIYGAIGFHPDEIDTLTDFSFEILEKHLTNPKIVALGEIGLDYYHNKENKEEQKKLFIRQIKLAQKYNKTIVIHSRDAIEDTYDILEKYLNGHKAVLHCYSGSLEMAKKFQKLGVKFGIGGVVTFKKAFKIKEVVENVPLDSLLLETDSPFLTPEPYRGKPNEPYNVYYVALKISELTDVSLEKVLKITSQNAISTFDLPIQI